jgi:hypothetical protein
MDLKEEYIKCGLDSSGCSKGTMAGFCEHDDEHRAP